MKTLICLSVRQPWAYLIVNGSKDIENRTWNTSYRGMLGIHSSKKFDWAFFEMLDELAPDDPLQMYGDIVRCRFGIVGKRITQHLDEFGAIIGTATLVETIATDENCGDELSPWAFDCGFAWRLKNAVALPQPIPAKGKLHFWKFNIKD